MSKDYDQQSRHAVKRLAEDPSDVKRVAMKIDNFDALINAHIPYGKVTLEDIQQPTIVEFDGAAKDNNRANPYLPTDQELASVDGYQQLLWWYFGGKPYRITKAIRIPYNYKHDDGQEYSASLLIGYQGPGN
jgi:hypothetical protein